MMSSIILKNILELQNMYISLRIDKLKNINTLMLRCTNSQTRPEGLFFMVYYAQRQNPKINSSANSGTPIRSGHENN